MNDIETNPIMDAGNALVSKLSAREIAKRVGATTYVAGTTCTKGHGPERRAFTSQGACVSCYNAKLKRRYMRSPKADKLTHIRIADKETREKLERVQALYAELFKQVPSYQIIFSRALSLMAEHAEGLPTSTADLQRELAFLRKLTSPQ